MPHTDRPENLCNSGDVALQDYFTLWLERLELSYDRRFEDLDTKISLALDSADKAVSKAETATEKRFEGVNEFRGTLADQANKLMPRDEYNARHDALVAEIKQLREGRISVIETQIARLYGGLAVVAFLGIANLVKLWFAH